MVLSNVADPKSRAVAANAQVALDMAAKASTAAMRRPRWITEPRGAARAKTWRSAPVARISERQAVLGAVPVRSSNTLLMPHMAQVDFTDFELIFLGTSAGSPSVRRNPTSLCVRLSHQNWMFDCAEGSLRQLMKSIIRVPLTNKFFITHLHGDHVYGLPGILCTLDNHNAAYIDPATKKGAPKPIDVFGPLGLFSYLNTALATSSTRMANLRITVHELVSPEMLKNMSAHEKFMQNAPCHPVRHHHSLHFGYGEAVDLTPSSPLIRRVFTARRSTPSLMATAASGTFWTTARSPSARLH